MNEDRHLWDPDYYKTNYDRYVGGQTLGKMHVISVHLWLEYILVQCLKSHLPDPEALFNERGVSFAQLISLCEAHRVIDKKMARVLRTVNRVRNKCAHELTFNPAASDWMVLDQAISEVLPPARGDTDTESLRRLADCLEAKAIAMGVIEPVRAQQSALANGAPRRR